VRYVGGGSRPQTRGGNGAGFASRSSAASVDDLHDDDARSTTASSYVSSSHMSAQVTRSVHGTAAPVKDQAMRRAMFEISRDSSKESSNSESDEQLERVKEQVKSRASQSSLSSETSRLSQQVAGRPSTPPPAAAHSPTSSRRSTRLMVKSYSQDTPNDIGKRRINEFAADIPKFRTPTLTRSNLAVSRRFFPENNLQKLLCFHSSIFCNVSFL
jgi:hypothetical protein